MLYVCGAPHGSVEYTAGIVLHILQLQRQSQVGLELVQGSQLGHSKSGAVTRVVRLQMLCSTHSNIRHCPREL